MDVQLQELVEKIRKDGVETAEAKAAEIIKSAEERARGIHKTAVSEAEALLSKAKEEAARTEKAAVATIGQAARNILISFRDALTAQLDTLVKSGTAQTYDSTVLKELIPRVVQAWAAHNGDESVNVLLSPTDAAALESVFRSALKKEIDAGMQVQVDSSITGGFRIGTRNGAAFYDFSAEAVAELFSAYLNPRIAEILKSAAKEL